MKREYLVSIIIPVYGTEKYLARCVDSCLAQTYGKFELILVDDGSPDNCGSICDEYSKQDERVIVFHKENGGVASAKNYGIQRAKGTYITFVDSDDYIDSNYLEELIISNQNNSDMVIAGLKYWNEDASESYSSLQLKERVHFSREQYGQYISWLLDERGLNYHVAKLYKRELIKNNNITFTDFRVTGGDDTIFNFEVLSVANLVSVSKCNIYNYIIYENSVSHRYTGDKWKRSKNLDQRLYDISKSMNILDANLQKVLDKRVVYSALWSAAEIAHLQNEGVFAKKLAFMEIMKDGRFQEAYQRTKSMVEYDRKVSFLYNGSWILFYIYERQLGRKICAKVYKYVPKPLINIYRRIRGRSYN